MGSQLVDGRGTIQTQVFLTPEPPNHQIAHGTTQHGGNGFSGSWHWILPKRGVIRRGFERRWGFARQPMDVRGTPGEEIAWERTEWPKVAWVSRTSPAVWHCWLLRREAGSLTRDDVGGGRGSSIKHIICPAMKIWDYSVGNGEPLKGLRTKTGVRVCNVFIFAVSYKGNLDAFWKILWRLSPERWIWRPHVSIFLIVHPPR